MITNSEIYNREIPSVGTPSPESSLFRFHRPFHNNVQHKPSILYPYPLHCLVIATMISSKKVNSVYYFFRYTFVLSVDSNKTATTAHINARSRHTSYTRTRTHRLMKWKYKKKLKIYRPKAQLDQKILKKYRANTAYPHIPHTPPKATHRPAVADSLADSFEEEKKTFLPNRNRLCLKYTKTLWISELHAEKIQEVRVIQISEFQIHSEEKI